MVRQIVSKPWFLRRYGNEGARGYEWESRVGREVPWSTLIPSTLAVWSQTAERDELTTVTWLLQRAKTTVRLGFGVLF